jgi:hypothetical protein
MFNQGLAGRFGSRGHNIDSAAVLIEQHSAIDQRKQGEILPLTDVPSSPEAIADLADQDVARPDGFATELFDAALLRIRIAAVPRRTLAFFMSHD